MGTPMMWMPPPHGMAAVVLLAPLALATVWPVLRRTAPRHRRDRPGTGEGKGR